MPGTRFTIWGADVHLEFEKGKTREQIQFLLNWIDGYLRPIAEAEDREREVDGDRLVAVGEDGPALTAPEVESPSGVPAPIKAWPFIKQANGHDMGGFKPEDYERNR